MSNSGRRNLDDGNRRTSIRTGLGARSRGRGRDRRCGTDSDPGSNRTYADFGSGWNPELEPEPGPSGRSSETLLEPDNKVTESSLSQKQKRIRENEEFIKNDINDFLKDWKSRLWRKVIIINFNMYCPTPEKYHMGSWNYLPGEIGLTACDIKEGKIIESFSTLIDPGSTPHGYGLAVKEGRKLNGLPVPGKNSKFQDYESILLGIQKFISKYSTNGGERSAMFCYRKEMVPFYSCMDWLFSQSKQKDGKVRHPNTEFRLRPLEMLLEKVTEFENNVRPSHRFGNLVRSGSEKSLNAVEESLSQFGRFINEDHAFSYLNYDIHNFDDEMACDFHKEPENQEPGLEFCSELVTQRLANRMIAAMDQVYNFK